MVSYYLPVHSKAIIGIIKNVLSRRENLTNFKSLNLPLNARREQKATFIGLNSPEE